MSTAIVLAAVTALAPACPDKPNAVRERSEMLMDTVVQVKASGCDEDALTAAFDEIRRVESLMSRFDPDSELSRLNRAPETPVEVSRPTWDVLRTAQRIYEASGGSFDPTISAALDLWESKVAAPPSPDELRKVKRLIGWDKVRLSPERKVSLEPGMSLNLDGIAKGYAADRAARALRERGCTRALVNAGGDIRLYSEKESKPWKVAIENGNIKLILNNGGVATSGLGKRHISSGGKNYPHIMDPATLRPVNHSVISVTAVSDTAAEADGWATAAMVTGEHALRKGDKEGVGFALLTDNGRWEFNRAWNERVRFEPLSPPGKP